MSVSEMEAQRLMLSENWTIEQHFLVASASDVRKYHVNVACKLTARVHVCYLQFLTEIYLIISAD